MENILNREVFCLFLGNFFLLLSYDVVIGILLVRGNIE